MRHEFLRRARRAFVVLAFAWSLAVPVPARATESTFADNVQMSVSGAPGTGTITLGSAMAGHQSAAAADVPNGAQVSYYAYDPSNGAWEDGQGTYSSSGPTITRGPLWSSASGSAVDLTSAAIIALTPLAEDFPAHPVGGPTSWTANDLACVAADVANHRTIGDCNLSPSSSGWTTQAAGDNTTHLATTAFVNGGWHLLNTLTASSSASLFDTSSFTGAYEDYELIFDQVVPATNEAGCYIQVYVGGSFKTSGYLAYGVALGSGGATVGAAVTNEILCAATSSSAGNPSNSAPGINGKILISDPAAGYAEISGTTAGLDGGGAPVSWNSAGFYNASGAVTGVEIVMSSGNITSGTIKIYGRN